MMVPYAREIGGRFLYFFDVRYWHFPKQGNIMPKGLYHESS
jgi:hypothetical protein